MCTPLLALLVALTAPAAAAAPDDPDDLVAEALASHPVLASFDAGILALEDTAEVAAVWSDPAAMVEYSNVPIDGLGLAGHPMAGLQLKVQQRLHISGAPSARASLGASRVDDAALARQQQAELLALELRRAYCFCSLIREAKDPKVSPLFCYRAAGWAKQFWEPILGVKFTRCDITHSILKGDRFCAWDYHLP